MSCLLDGYGLSVCFLLGCFGFDSLWFSVCLVFCVRFALSLFVVCVWSVLLLLCLGLGLGVPVSCLVRSCLSWYVIKVFFSVVSLLFVADALSIPLFWRAKRLFGHWKVRYLVLLRVKKPRFSPWLCLSWLKSCCTPKCLCHLLTVMLSLVNSKVGGPRGCLWMAFFLFPTPSLIWRAKRI